MCYQEPEPTFVNCEDGTNPGCALCAEFPMEDGTWVVGCAICHEGFHRFKGHCLTDAEETTAGECPQDAGPEYEGCTRCY